MRCRFAYRVTYPWVWLERPAAGDLVIALDDVHDEASGRTIPQHARAGDTGMVIGYYGGDDVPTVNWSNGGIYDVALNRLAPYKINLLG